MSFYSKKLYRDVMQNWGGFAFLYLLLLLALSMVFLTYKTQVTFNKMFVKITDQFVAQVPVLTVKNGKISTPEKRPYLIKDADSKEVIAIIDTTGKYKSLEGTKAGLLITEDEMITNPKPTETRIDKVPPNVNFVFEPVVVNEYIKGFLGYAWILVFPVLVLVAFIYRIIQALIYAVIGRIFGAIVSAKINYAQTLIISLVSITPVIVLLTIMDMVGVEIANCGTWAFVIAMGYLFYGVFANKKR
jgi:hypothetical protein